MLQSEGEGKAVHRDRRLTRNAMEATSRRGDVGDDGIDGYRHRGLRARRCRLGPSRVHWLSEDEDIKAELQGSTARRGAVSNDGTRRWPELGFWVERKSKGRGREVPARVSLRRREAMFNLVRSKYSLLVPQSNITL
jgi:hypothetical protein